MKKKYTAEEIEKKKNYIVQRAFESIPGRIIIDEEGCILFFSEQHERFTGISAKDAVGKSVLDIIPNSRLPAVVKTGIPEIGVLSYYANRKKNEIVPEISNRMPVFEGDKIIGALGIGIISDQFNFDNIPGNMMSADIFNLDYSSGMSKDIAKADKAMLKGMVAVSKQMLDIKETVKKIAPTPLPVLIWGETGTGKEILACAIHEASGRRMEDFVQINCAAIPDELLESELFGYEEGAFSGAVKGGKIGKFEYAKHGTILLDEIGDMPLPLQSKLLRVVQEKKFEKIGGVKSIPFNARIISTTNKDLPKQIQEGAFRQDLYYRLNAVEIYVPPLRERREDIEVLCCQFIDHINEELGLKIDGMDVETLKFLTEYDWPGNVRELRNVIERACCMSEGPILRKEQFRTLSSKNAGGGVLAPGPASVEPAREPGAELKNSNARVLNSAKREAETEKIVWALTKSGGNKAQAAKLLGISRSVLYDKIKRYQVKL